MNEGVWGSVTAVAAGFLGIRKKNKKSDHEENDEDENKDDEDEKKDDGAEGVTTVSDVVKNRWLGVFVQMIVC